MRCLYRSIHRFPWWNQVRCSGSSKIAMSACSVSLSAPPSVQMCTERLQITHLAEGYDAREIPHGEDAAECRVVSALVPPDFEGALVVCALVHPGPDVLLLHAAVLRGKPTVFMAGC